MTPEENFPEPSRAPSAADDGTAEPHPAAQSEPAPPADDRTVQSSAADVAAQETSAASEKPSEPGSSDGDGASPAAKSSESAAKLSEGGASESGKDAANGKDVAKENDGASEGLKGRKKAWSVIFTVLVSVILLAALVALAVAIGYRVQGETLTVGGMQYRIVLTGSMEGDREDSIRTDSLIGIRVVPEEEAAREAFFAELGEGDIITFNDWSRTGAAGDPLVNTHRIVEVIGTGDGVRYRTQGDANSGPDARLVEQGDVIGVVEWNNYPLGAMLSFLCSAKGIVICLIVPAGLILIFEVINIVRIVRSDKRREQQQETAAREQEIERLRRELEELKRGEGK